MPGPSSATSMRAPSPERALTRTATSSPPYDQQIDEEVEAAWSVEIQRRLHRLDDGVAKTVPWAEARRRILAAADRDAEA